MKASIDLAEHQTTQPASVMTSNRTSTDSIDFINRGSVGQGKSFVASQSTSKIINRDKNSLHKVRRGSSNNSNSVMLQNSESLQFRGSAPAGQMPPLAAHKTKKSLIGSIIGFQPKKQQQRSHQSHDYI